VLVPARWSPTLPAPAERRESTPAPTTPATPTARPAAPAGLPHVATSFSAAKHLLYTQVYTGHRVSFYCGCAFDAQRVTELHGCGLGPLANEKRAQHVEADHIFPAAQFGQARPCWRDSAAFSQCTPRGQRPLTRRQCCEQVDPLFATAHNDLNNLVPAVGEINGKRSDYNWGRVSGGERFGDCAIRIDAGIRRVQPPPAVRGDIGRIMLYMRDTYGFNLSRQDEQLYVAWSNTDPPNAWEIERDQRISRIQGRGNRYVEATVSNEGKRSGAERGGRPLVQPTGQLKPALREHQALYGAFQGLCALDLSGPRC
jgi:deoxyribonuclease-1